MAGITDRPEMIFIMAPEWFMKLDDNHILYACDIIILYNRSPTTSISMCISNGYVPYPNVPMDKNSKTKYAWSVKYLKNFVKLPTELNDAYKKL